MTGKKQVDYENSPTAWFCTLEIARKKKDCRLIAKADGQLRNLGVFVRFLGERDRVQLAHLEEVLK